MCFGKTPSVETATIAPAPPPAEKPPEETELTTARKKEEDATFGPGGPTTRVDRSSTESLFGGSGLKM